MPHRQAHAMMGRGGEIRVPKSESEELRRIRILVDSMLATTSKIKAEGLARAIKRIVSDLEEQVSQGYHRNPYTPFRVVGPIAEDVYDIRYRHKKNGKDYEHEFNGAVNILAIERHGKKDMLITSERGLPLWGEFPDE